MIASSLLCFIAMPRGVSLLSFIPFISPPYSINNFMNYIVILHMVRRLDMTLLMVLLILEFLQTRMLIMLVILILDIHSNIQITLQDQQRHGLFLLDHTTFKPLRLKYLLCLLKVCFAIYCDSTKMLVWILLWWY